FGLRLALRLAPFLLIAAPLLASAQPKSWVPTHPVELVVGVSPGGGIDRTARTVQRIVQDKRLIDVPLNVINKPGGGGTIAQTYLNQHAGDAHYVVITATSLLTNHIIGRTPIGHHHFTPVAMLYDEYLGVAVNADSPIKTGRELLNALNKPEALPIGIAASAGNTNHIGAALLAKAAGVEAKRLKVVVFGSGGESMTALMGGHVALVVTPSANLIGPMQNGRIRILGVAAPERIPGPLASVPTWTEQGVDAVVANWRPVIGAKGWSPAQIAYWEEIYSRLVASDEWKAEIARTGGVPHFMRSRELGAFFEAEETRFRSILTDLGLAK
ncbi:MAG: tripartite tricarboxylate transporter substrate binding protein, partial [Burkholderiales bacterium]